MSVNWDWKDRKGKIVWKPKQMKDEKFQAHNNIEWNFYHANCWGCFLKEWKEDDKEMYSFMTFFSDLHHTKKLLGLEKDYNKEYSDWFKNIYLNYEIDYVELDLAYPYNDKIAKYFAKAGYDVRVYDSTVNKMVPENEERHPKCGGNV